MTREDDDKALYQFFGGYFHEDWVLEADTPRDVIEAFKATGGWSSDKIKALSKAILEFSQRYPTEKELEEHLLLDLGCNYNMAADGLAASEWLRQVAAQLIDERV
jgi:hypothetical protein